MAEEYIKRKHGKEKSNTCIPLLDTILKDTYGVIVYQEQVMQIAQVLVAYTMGDADILRAAMGKKRSPRNAAQRERFVDGPAPKKSMRKKPTEISTRWKPLRAMVSINRTRRRTHCILHDRLFENSLSGRVHGVIDDLGNGRHR